MTTGRGGSAPLASDADDDGAVLRDAKAAFRRAALARREAVFRHAPAAAGEMLADNVLAAIDPPPGAVVSGFLPIGDEIDPRPLMRRLFARGHVLAVPVVRGRGRPLVFREWAPGAPLVDGVFGVQVPPDGTPEHIPQILIVPLLAFDRRGHRMGYGAGFYDRTLDGLRRAGHCLAIGVGFAGQAVETVPTGPHDEPLDLVATEREVIDLRRAPGAAAGTG